MSLQLQDVNALDGEFNGSAIIEATDVRLLAHGEEHPLFGVLEPNETRAYISYKICRALPKVIGPESHGKYLGFHPQVLHRCHKGLLHQQNNLNHKLMKYGSYKDAIMGCVVGTAVNASASTMGIPESIDEAPWIDVLAVVFKNASGVEKMLGEHLTGKPWSVSIESRARYSDSGIYVPSDREIVSFADVKGALKNHVKFSAETGLTLGVYKGKQLAMAMGGQDGHAFYDGVGYTRNPAEDTAEITQVRATSEGEFSVAACAAPEWVAGMSVKWTKVLMHDEGGGVIQSIAYDGDVAMHSTRLTATPENPVFLIKLPYSGVVVPRHADSVSKV